MSVEFVRVVSEATVDADGEYVSGRAELRVDGEPVYTATNPGEVATESAARWVRDVLGVDLVPADRKSLFSARLADVAAALDRCAQGLPQDLPQNLQLAADKVRLAALEAD